MEEKLKELQAQYNHAAGVFFEHRKQMEQAEEVLKRLNAQISLLQNLQSTKGDSVGN